MLATEPALLLQTKLHPPRVAHGSILRQHLFDLLDRGVNDAVTLVSAPPGYGKSVLLTTWLKERNLSFGWLSLDEGDNEFGMFLQYLLAAVQKQRPEACHRLSTFLNSLHSYDAVYLAHQLAESLASYDEEVLLVLDDCHRINNKQVHEFLSTLIESAPPLLRLILLTRRDPPLPLNTLRSQGRLSEIRMLDLRFGTQEVMDFLAPDVGDTLSEKALNNLTERIEGWAVGLRLVTLNLRYCQDPDKFLGDLNGSPQVVREYLMNEVLAKQPSPFRECLLKVAVLDRFCAQLCKDLCLSVSPELQSYCEKAGGSGDFPLMENLLESNLFMISLDDDGTWYRFHHLFQDFLLEHLRSEKGEPFVCELHGQAAKWYEREGLLEESVVHALKGSDSAQAVEIVKTHLQSLFQHEKKLRLSHLIRQLPVEQVVQEPELLILQAWTKFGLLDLEEVGILEQIEGLIEKMPADSERVRRIRGALHVMRCVQYYECTDTVMARKHAESALMLLETDQWLEQGTLMIMQALLLQMEGSADEARALIFAAFEDKDLLETSFHTRLLAALCFINWLEGNLEAMVPFAQELEQLGNKLDLPETISHALYFKALVHYERNEIDQAEDQLTVIVEEYPDVNFLNTMHSTFALALVYEAQGRNAEASIVVKNILQKTLEVRIASLYATSAAVRAEINMRVGKVAEAVLWAKSFKQSPHRASYRFYVAHITMSRVLLAEGSEELREDALALLLQLEGIYTKNNNKRFLIHVLALKALCLLRMQQEQPALEDLQRAVILAQPGGFIKLFIDTGSELIPLFNRLKLDVEGLEYVGRILSGFTNVDGGGVREGFMPSGDAQPGIEDPLIDALTDRELEVLFSLASRLSNREIGEKLFIAPGTVKRHTNTIYRKLNVHGRRDAVAKARGLGLLPVD